METRHARMLREIAEAGRFSTASERLGIGQSALSKIVRRVEDEFGAPVFERGPQGASLTSFGRVFMAYAQVVERETRDLSAAATAMQKGKRGHFRIGAGQTWIHDLMPTILREVHSARPNLTLRVVTGSVPELVDQVASGDIDLAFGSDSVPLTLDLVFEELIRDQLMIVARKDHPLSRLGRPCELRDLWEYGWIMGESNHSDQAYSWLLTVAQNEGLPEPTIVLETHQKHLVVSLVQSTDLLAFEPSHAPVLLRGDIVPVSGQQIARQRGTGMIWRRRREIPPGLQFVMDTARNVAAASRRGPDNRDSEQDPHK